MKAGGFGLLWLMPLLLLCLASCSDLGRSVSYSQATFVAARPNQLIVETGRQAVALDDFSNGVSTSQRLLPLNADAKVTAGGKESSLQKLHEGQRIRIGRDDRTGEVVAIEGL